LRHRRANIANIIGYARVSSTDQDASIQEAALKAAGAGVVLAEKISGTSRDGRTMLETALKLLQSGDTLLVTRLDRLGRSVRDLSNIVRELQARGASLRCTEQAFDTTGAAGKAMLGMPAVFAEFETNIRRERQMEGIAKAKAAGKYKGRPVTVDAVQVRALKSRGPKPTEIAE
jgi:DNA invertase Pin-like site-specific DNA recombinase